MIEQTCWIKNWLWVIKTNHAKKLSGTKARIWDSKTFDLLKNPNFNLTLKIITSYMFWFRNEWPKWQIWASHMSPCKEWSVKRESEKVHIEQLKRNWYIQTQNKKWLSSWSDLMVYENTSFLKSYTSKKKFMLEVLLN